MNGELFVKFNILDMDKDKLYVNNGNNNNSNIYFFYAIPSEDNYDYKMITDKTLGTISLNIRNLSLINNLAYDSAEDFKSMG